MIVRILGLVAALLLTATSTANQLVVDREGILSPLPACDVPGPAPVMYVPVTQRFINSHGGAIASAGYNEVVGRFFIMYDKIAMQSYPPEFQRWVFAHECAHHQLGHTQTKFNPANRTQVNQDERAADCTAAQYLKGMSDQQWDIVIASISDQQKIRRFAGVPPGATQDQFGYHSDLEDRVATVKQCLREVGR